MAKLANPNAGAPFGYVSKDIQGNDEYGYRMVDGVEEIVHIPTGKSNMEYYTPEKYTFYENCPHKFRVVNMGLREVECVNDRCRLMTSFHPAVNYKEENGKAFIVLSGRDYEITVS